MDPVLSTLRSAPVEEVLLRHGVEDAYLFGSRARGAAQPASDIDIAIRFPRAGDAATRFDKLVALEADLKPHLSVPMDLVCVNDVAPILAFEAVVRGITVYSRDQDQTFLYEVLVRHRYEDELHILEIFTEAMKRRLGVT